MTLSHSFAAISIKGKPRPIDDRDHSKAGNRARYLILARSCPTRMRGRLASNGQPSAQTARASNLGVRNELDEDAFDQIDMIGRKFVALQETIPAIWSAKSARRLGSPADDLMARRINGGRWFMENTLKLRRCAGFSGNLDRLVKERLGSKPPPRVAANRDAAALGLPVRENRYMRRNYGSHPIAIESGPLRDPDLLFFVTC